MHRSRQRNTLGKQFMNRKFSLTDIKTLNPSLKGDKEVFIIKAANTNTYFEIYLNTDHGCEYALYEADFSEIDGGVIDDVDYESDDNVANLILYLLEDLGVKGHDIIKIAESDIPMFDDKTELKWKEKIEAIKKQLSLENRNRLCHQMT